MIEANKRRRQTRRLSIFTDIIIIAILILIFWLLISIVKHISKPEIFDDSLALEKLDSFDKNEILSNKILTDFGVKVVYGISAEDDAKRVDASVQLNNDIIANNLIEIYNVFSTYPIEYFKNANLTVIILDSFYNNNIALASRNSMEEYKIYISNAEEYDRSLYHEMYHVFEYMLKDEIDDVTQIWMSLNPAEFEYTSDVYKISSKYVYDEGDSLENVYFVTRYSKASNKEDRAEVFAEIMTFDRKKQEFLSYENCPIRTKAKFIIDVMSNEYNSKNLKWNIF